MDLSDFEVGKTFKRGSRTWLCTDIGSRVIVAICISPPSKYNDWFRDLGGALQDYVWSRSSLELTIDEAIKSLDRLQEHVFNEATQKECKQ